MTPMRLTLVRACLLVVAMGTCFTLGTGPDWRMVILSVVTLICALIGLICFEFVRTK